MRKDILVMMMALVLALALTTPCFAAPVKTKTINVTATVPTLNDGLSVALYKITPSAVDCTGANDTWPAAPNATSIAFGTLVRSGTYNIWMGSVYYAMDVAVLDNSGTAWTVTHTRTAITNGAGLHLNNNVNAVFYKLVYDPTTHKMIPVEPPIYKIRYADSNGKTVTKTQAAGMSFRIYYGIATGIGPSDPNPHGCTTDAAANMAIPLTQTAGAYQGQVTLTLTP